MTTQTEHAKGVLAPRLPKEEEGAPRLAYSLDLFATLVNSRVPQIHVNIVSLLYTSARAPARMCSCYARACAECRIGVYNLVRMTDTFLRTSSWRLQILILHFYLHDAKSQPCRRQRLKTIETMMLNFYIRELDVFSVFR
ncbi:unnamed protein product [Trichogramma brassicae]|uniref:Uncharacterized protein n=1 Tax=Trichogramma brassicae TaxID=86971 RepID=A0A6H5J5C5_9HYME|nr:unnamed protein product [Trichogramma brassicae]